MDLDKELDTLRARVAERTELVGVGPGVRFGARLKKELIATTRRAREQGLTISQVARTLGMDKATLYRWLRADTDKAQGELREVKVLEPDAPTREPRTHPDGDPSTRSWPRVTLPGGIVVEGLDTEQLAALVRALQ